MEKEIKNTRRRTVYITRGFVVLGIFLVFGPINLGMDGFDGGFALAFIGIVVALTAFICVWIFRAQAKHIDILLQEKGILAHRIYGKEERETYTEQEHQRNKKAKLMLFYVVTGFAAIAAIAFPIYDNDDGRFVSAVMGVLVVLIGFVAGLSIILPHRNNKKHIGEAMIFKTGVILNGIFHVRNVGGPFAARLDNVSIHKKPPYIQFTYSTPNRGSRASFDVNVPIPEGKETEADKVFAIVSKHVHI